jgi:hypothetical protein
MGSMSEPMAGGATRAGSPRPFLESEERREKGENPSGKGNRQK